MLTPAEIARKTIDNGRAKASLGRGKMVLLGVMAGAFIAMGAQGSNLAAAHLLAGGATFGLGKLVAGAIFGTGLMMVLLCGAELFTGNCLILAGVLDGQVPARKMLENWFFVYIGNFIGGLAVALLVAASGQLSSMGGELGGMTIKIAAGKVSNSFAANLTLGVLCNFLVCLAVWMATAAEDAAGKILAVFFPIMLFVTSGFEHSVANMYYIPAGILAKAVPAYCDAALALGVSAEQLDALGWASLWTGNIIPVTAGNIIGGCIFVGLVYWFGYRKKA